MKLIKRIFYGIVILIMVCCGAVIVCALNPSLTKSLATAISGTPIVDNQSTSDNVAGDEGAGIQQVPQGVLPGKAYENGYVAPSQENMKLPEPVYGLTGYQPIQGEESQIAEEEAETLKDTLETGSTGEELTFDTQLYPYYGMLEPQLQKLYNQIYANAQECKTSFAPVIPVNVAQFKNVFEAVCNDHPELFWLETSYSCKYKPDGQCMEITLKYNNTINMLEQAKENVQTQVQSILNGIQQLTTDAEKEKYIHDALVERVTYDVNTDMSQSAYSALVNGKSVCAGYARAFQYLMQQAGIPCYYCTGYSGEDHAWNIVKLGMDYYNTDVTWDDTDPSTYDYFNKTDAEYAKTHMRTNLSIYLPACGSAVSGSQDVGDTGEVADTAQGDDEGTEEEEIQYINPDPQEPMTLPNSYFNQAEKEKMEKEANMNKAGITEDDIMDDLKEYYADCLKQMVEVGAGQKYFSNVIPKSLWSSVELAYSEGGHKKGYVEEGLKKLEKDEFAVQLQIEDLGGGYYRIYHNISTWDNEF